MKKAGRGQAPPKARRSRKDGRKPAATEEQRAKILASWREQENISRAARKAGVSRETARTIIDRALVEDSGLAKHHAEKAKEFADKAWKLIHRCMDVHSVNLGRLEALQEKTKEDDPKAATVKDTAWIVNGVISTLGRVLAETGYSRDSDEQPPIGYEPDKDAEDKTEPPAEIEPGKPHRVDDG
jgi:hypothetical protein